MSMLESELQSNVIELAELYKWRCVHFRPSMDRHGRWSTAIQGAEAAGFPDIVMVRDRLIMVELKSDRGRTSVAQQDWLFALSNADVEVHLWRPVHWTDGTIEKVLA